MSSFFFRLATIPPRPLRTMSKKFSRRVPSIKCSGLQQRRLSQECMITFLTPVMSTSGLARWNAIRCAEYGFRPIFMRPYPEAAAVERQFQHWSDSPTFTFNQKRKICFSVISGIGLAACLRFFLAIWSPESNPAEGWYTRRDSLACFAGTKIARLT